MHKTRLVNFLLLLVCLQVSAYSDHRGKKTDSLEAVLACAELGQTEQVRQLITHIYNGMEHFSTNHYQSGLSQMEVLYETEKKRSEAEQKQKENDQLRQEKQWLLWGGILTALVLLLAALTFFLLWRSIRLKRRTALTQAKLEGELAERVRLSRDLHDRLGGILTALRQHLEPGHEALPLTDQAIGEMRNVAHHLLPDSLRRHGLRVALRDYCHTMKNVSFSFVGEEQSIAHEEAIYCMVYELVNNAVKSSGAQHISVQLIADTAFTAINVSDDGNGFAQQNVTAAEADESAGSGMNNIRERVLALGGRIDIFAHQGEGTEVNIELPNDK